MQLCPVFVLPNKSLSVGAPRSRQNTRKSRPGPGGWGKLPSDGSPRAFRPPRSPGRRCRLHPKINSDSRSRPRLTPPRPHPSRPLAPPGPQPRPSPLRPGRGFAPETAASRPDPDPGSPATGRAEAPRGLQVGPGRGQAPEGVRPRPGSCGRGHARPGRHLPAPHRPAAPQSSPGADQLRPEA